MDRGYAPYREWFAEWQARTGEAAPAFASMRAWADLPPLLAFSDGRPVDGDAWPARAAEIRALLERYFWGAIPREAPVLCDAAVLWEERERGVIRRGVRLTFAGDPPVPVIIETLTPEGPGPHPVFLTQTTHRAWAVLGVSRGYLGCVYPAADEDDQSLQFVSRYPECDWATIPRRAWLAGRVLDYLQALPEADMRHVTISGHSRNGKQSLIAAALDPRITAVVSSSSGAGGASPYRFTSEREFLESVEYTTWMCPDWFHPRLRFFTGREQYLPIDTHGYLALIAPRACLLSTAFNDGCESPFAVERAWQAGREVYQHLNADGKLRIRWRAGNHETCAEDIQAYFDWFDLVRDGQTDGPRADALFPMTPLFRTPPGDAPPPPAGDARAALAWALGDAPPVGVEWGGCYARETAHDAQLMGRADLPEGVAKVAVQFSDDVAGDLYYPAGATEPLPVVIWLHPYADSAGYPGAYVNEPDTWQPLYLYHELARRGYACFAFDQLGYGRRIGEGINFYARYPHWSKLGKMLRDVQGAVDLLTGGEGRAPYVCNPRFAAALPALDPARIACVGYALGGLVGLYAAALDARIAGVASCCGFTPMRTDTDDRPTGGLRRLWDWYGLLPRLTAYHGREAELPYDYDDLLGLIAPRPCLLIAPTGDRDADAAAMAACAARARSCWGNAPSVQLAQPEDYSRFQRAQYEMLFDWLASV